MRNPLVFVVLVGAVACGGSQTTQGGRAHTLATGRSADNLSVTAADAPERTNHTCGFDLVLNDQLTSGGEPLTSWFPCWEVRDELAEVRREERRVPPAAWSAELAQTELPACQGIPEHQLTRSPFAQQEAIAEVVPYREDGEVRGARLVFSQAPGLTADWMRRAIACHQERYASLGHPADYLPGDPMLIEGAELSVTERDDGRVVVVISTPDDDTGLLALERAEDLVREPTARR